MTEIFREGETAGVQTDCKTKQDFLAEFTAALLVEIESKNHGLYWVDQLECLFGRMAEICCYYEGHSVAVHIETSISSGFLRNEKPLK